MLPDFELEGAILAYSSAPRLDYGLSLLEVPEPPVIPRSWIDDLKALTEHRISTVRQLLDVEPFRLLGGDQLFWDALKAYRYAARWWLRGASLGARYRLSETNWSDSAIGRLSDGLAHQLADRADRGSEEPIEVVVQMRDVIPADELRRLTRAARIGRRQEQADRTQRPLLEELGLAVEQALRLPLSNQLITPLTPAQIRRAAEAPSVREIGPVLSARSCVTACTTRVRASNLRSKYRGRDQVIALIDSGVDDQHSDFRRGQIVHQYKYKDDNVHKDDKDYLGGNCKDEYGHGTHLAGIMGSQSTTLGGVAPEAEIWCYRALDSKGEGSYADLAKALEHAIHDAKNALGDRYFVVNCSFSVPRGQFNSDNDLNAFVKQFSDAITDAVIVAAAGNAGPEDQSITAPGRGTGVLTVGASLSRPDSAPDVVSWFSSRGPAPGNVQKPNVVAPGGFKLKQGEAHKDVSVCSASLAKGTLDYDTSDQKPWRLQGDLDHWGLSGSSQAAAVVSGVCALLLEKVAGRSISVQPDQIVQKLKDTASRLGYSDNEEGHGLINADEAMKAL